MYILSYTLNFTALAFSHFGSLFNLLFCEWLITVVPLALMPVNLMWEGIFLWTFVGGSLSYLFGARLGFNRWVLLKQGLREIALLSCLYGSISVRFSIMSFTHLFGLNLSFGATSKDDTKITLMDWIRSTPMECAVYTFYGALMIVKLLFLTKPEKLIFVLYFGCIPMIWSIFLFWAGPIFWDILPNHIDKTTQESYMKEDMMFEDKYFTQIPNSSTFMDIKVGLNMKLSPH